MYLKHFILGFGIKTVASFDDTVSKLPIILGMTSTTAGKVAFAVGNMIALLLAVFLAIFFSSIFKDLPWFHYVVAGIIYLLAVVVYFDVFVKSGSKLHKGISKSKRLSSSKVMKLVATGFIVSFIALFDDTLVFIPLFDGTLAMTIAAVVGIVTSTLIQLVLVIFFSDWLQKFPYTKALSVGGLLIFGTLVLVEFF